MINLKRVSIWQDDNYKKFPKLDEDKDVDLLIIGGGITGASLLYHLKKSNLKVLLAEQNRVGYSVTGSSTGKLNFLQNDLIDSIRNNFNDEVARLYLKSQMNSIRKIVDVISKENIDCDIKKVDSYLYTNKNNEIDKIKEVKKFLSESGIEVFDGKSDLVKSKYMIYVEGTYVFHPIKFIHGLIDDCDNVYEKTSIKKIEKRGEKYICHTGRNVIKTKYVAVCSHYPFFNIPFLFPIKGSLEKSYLSACKSRVKPISLISYTKPFISIRTHKDYLIYLSNTDSLNKCIDDSKYFGELCKKVSDLNINPDYLWSNIDIMTNDALPYIGKIKENMFIATGYNTWGLTNGFLAGSIISDILMNRDNEYAKLYNPKRVNAIKCLKTITDIYENISGYIKGFNGSNKSIKEFKDCKSTLKVRGSSVSNKCPHMGCGLIYNCIEKTFDCPCHGSRFDINGKCLSGPANDDI